MIRTLVILLSAGLTWSCASLAPAADDRQPTTSAAQPASEPVPATAASDQPPPASPAPAPTAAKPCQPACIPFRVRPQDQVWAVSTRNLGWCCGDSQEPGWLLWRYEASQWKPAKIADFYATDRADIVTPFYIHGNRIDHGLALRDGLDVYFQMAGKSDSEPPVRFVIWSWPSSQIKGPLKDIRSKACRTDIDGYYLARFLDGMQPEVQVGLIGYSYGARIITGGLHLLGGGNLAGRTIAAGDRPQMRVATWAAALHHDWLLSGRYHGQALAVAERWLVTFNCCDPALARYQWVEKCGDPTALGYSGMYGRNLLPAELNERAQELNVSGLVGGTHEMRAYLCSLTVQDRTRQYVLWHALEERKPVAQALAAAAAR